ncbi:MAG: hypothetical protein LQ348_007189 [Seirophora lacunosa]|nr:MAG: hypothetical protein LQ348_007189 [Seirophora lacunosa]
MASRSARRYIKLTNYAASRLSAIPLTPIREADEMQSPNSDIEETPPMPNIYAPPSSKPTEHEIASDTHPRNTTEARNAAIRASLKHLTATFKSAAEANTTRHSLRLANTTITISHAASKLLAAIDDWTDWIHTHHHERESFGQVEFPGFTMLKMAVLRSDVEELSEALTVVIIPLIETAREQQTMESVDAVRRAVGRYCEQVQGIGRDAGANAAMSAAGFEAHDHEIAMAAGGLQVEGLGEISQ